MAVSVRFYLFPEKSPPLRLSQRLVSGLTHGSDALPEFAGTSQRVLEVVLLNTNGKPEKIDRAMGAVWYFDENGDISDGIRGALRDIMNYAFQTDTASGIVVPLQPKISKRRYEDRYTWSPSSEDLALIAADIWPQTKTDRLAEAKGIVERKPPLTSDARYALTEINQKFWEIEQKLEGLSETALKGLIPEARKLATKEIRYSAFYQALVISAQRQQETQRQHRLGNGTWYAVVELLRREDANTSEIVKCFWERCSGRKAAAAASKKLLANAIELMDEQVAVETRLMTEYEWQAYDFPKED